MIHCDTLWFITFLQLQVLKLLVWVGDIIQTIRKSKTKQLHCLEKSEKEKGVMAGQILSEVAADEVITSHHNNVTLQWCRRKGKPN